MLKGKTVRFWTKPPKDGGRYGDHFTGKVVNDADKQSGMMLTNVIHHDDSQNKKHADIFVPWCNVSGQAKVMEG